jgi:exodeoxyribonuclease-5
MNSIVKVQSQSIATRTTHQQLTVADLSPDQHSAYSAIMTWMRQGTQTKQVLTLGGYAGTGKSALVSVVAHEMPSPLAFAAFTGKAASVLGRKLAASGIATVNRIAYVRDPLSGGRVFEPRPYCGTLHGLVYRPCDACMVEKEYPHTYGEECVADMDDAVEIDDGNGEPVHVAPVNGKCLGCDPPPPVKRDGPCTRCAGNRYLRRERLDRQYRLIVIDEASMVSDDMLTALRSYGIPILAVGDHGQLPPVKGTGSLMRAPDIRLEKIHRQAAGNPIIALSARIRETGEIDDALEDGEAFTILAQRNLDAWVAKRFPQARLDVDPTTAQGIMGTVLVSWTNRLRVGLNRDVRDVLGLAETAPQRGEALICLKNAAPIYNGMRGVLRADAVRAGDGGGKAPKWKATVDFTEDNQVAENILMSEHQFFEEKTIDYDKALSLGVSMAQLGALYDFGYALTCHKMQGSQAAEVGVVVEGGMARMPREDRIRWLYTAVTRAAERLTVIR